MVRLSRVEQQQRNRAKVLVAARQEFAEHGYAGTRVDGIAERAELTRGAVYSNFPSKRALYFAVLADLVEHWSEPPTPEPNEPVDPESAVQAFVRCWLARPTLAGEQAPLGARGLGFDLLSEVAADGPTRRAFAALTTLNAVLLGLGAERADSSRRPARRVRMAETVLTMLYGAEQLSAAAPGFVDPFGLVEAAASLASTDSEDVWAPPHLDFVPAATAVDLPWSAPTGWDLVSNRPVRCSGDGVVTVLGLARVSAVEEAVRAVPSGAAVTAVLVTGDAAELGPLARLTLAEACGCLRRALPASCWPALRIVLDTEGTIASAAGADSLGDETELAIRVQGERITATAQGRGAAHAVASLPVRPAAPSQRSRR